MQMLTERISSLSLERVEVLVQADAGGLPYNPEEAGADAFMAFMPGPHSTPSGGDWKACNWDVTRTGQYVFQCLVGPAGTATLAFGGYYVWGKVDDANAGEIPVEQLGRLFVD